MANEKVRIELMKANKPMWWLADIEGVCADTISRKLRHELPKEEQKRLIDLIKNNKDKDLSEIITCPNCGTKINTRRTK